MIAALTAVSGLVAAWALFGLRRELRSAPDRLAVWRRPVLTRREDLRLAALSSSATAFVRGLTLLSLDASSISETAVVPLLDVVAASTAVLSMHNSADERLVDYRDGERPDGEVSSNAR